MLKLEDKSLQISLSAPRFDWRMVVEPARFDLIYTCCCIFCSVPGKMRRVEKLFSGRWCFFGRRPRRWTSTSCCSKGSCTNYVNGQDSSRQSTIYRCSKTIFEGRRGKAQLGSSFKNRLFLTS